MSQPLASTRPVLQAPRRLPPTVIALGMTSFFTDLGSDMIFPLLPLFMASVGATPAFFGLVEGLADATSSLLKLGSGYVADRMPRKKPLVLFGYGVAAVAKPLMAIATAPWHVLAVRVADRVGKGVRTAPRDALLAGAAPPDQAGRAFGLHRAMDHAGAVAGPLIATALLGLGVPLRYVFAATIVPGLLSIAALLIVREPEQPKISAVKPSAAPASATPRLPRSFYRYLGIVMLFALGNSSDVFLLLRAQELGVSDALIPTLWVVLHVSKLLFSYLGGTWSDRIPRPRLIVLGWTIYGLVYLGLGLANSALHVWVLFVVYGAYYGLTEPVEKALVKDIAPREAHGRAFGLYNFVVGASALPASALTGWIWQSISPQAALSLGAAVAGVASIAMATWSFAWRRA